MTVFLSGSKHVKYLSPFDENSWIPSLTDGPYSSNQIRLHRQRFNNLDKFKIVVGFQEEGMKSTTCIVAWCHTQDVTLYHSKGNMLRCLLSHLGVAES